MHFCHKQFLDLPHEASPVLVKNRVAEDAMRKDDELSNSPNDKISKYFFTLCLVSYLAFKI